MEFKTVHKMGPNQCVVHSDPHASLGYNCPLEPLRPLFLFVFDSSFSYMVFEFHCLYRPIKITLQARLCQRNVSWK